MYNKEYERISALMNLRFLIDNPKKEEIREKFICFYFYLLKSRYNIIFSV